MRQRGDGATAFDDAAGQVSGAFVAGRPAASNPGLLLYVMVDSVEQSLKDVVGHGGEVVPVSGDPGGETIARFRDPAGNVIGLYQEP